MNYRIFLIILLISLLSGCNTYKKSNKPILLTSEQKYKNTGFALIYNDQLIKNNKVSKKIDNRSLLIFHKLLKNNSFVKITNPINQKTIIAKVVSNNVKFSDFYNSVITLRIAEELSLNINEPFINLVLISQNSSFIAKKAKTFDEEKNVAQKAPIDGIQIDNLGSDIKREKKIIEDDVFLYSIMVAEFYYKNSAENMINRIKNETNLDNYIIKKLSKTKYRVLIGPFNDIKKLEESFNKVKLLSFENLIIIKNV